jgi:hypothetical protein
LLEQLSLMDWQKPKVIQSKFKSKIDERVTNVKLIQIALTKISRLVFKREQ